MRNNPYGIMGRINDLEENELPDDETLDFMENYSVKSMCLPRLQKRVVHALRRLNATIVDAAINAAIDADKTVNLHQKVNAHLAKVEKNFTCTLLVCNNKMTLVNESRKVKRKCTKGPKKYVNFYHTEKNAVSVVSPSLEGQQMMEAAPAAPSLTVIETDVLLPSSERLRGLKDIDNVETLSPKDQQYICDEDTVQPVDFEEESWHNTFFASKDTDQPLDFEEEPWDNTFFVSEDSGHPLDIEEEPWDNTFFASEVETLSFDFQFEAAKEDTDQEVNKTPELQLICIPIPIEGFVCLCQWKHFLAAFQTKNINIWVVQMENHVFMAITTSDVTPSVGEAIDVVNIRYAKNHDALPLLAVQLLSSGWQNDKANKHVVAMLGMQGYWKIKPLEGNLCGIASSQISPFLLINEEQVEEMLPSWILEYLPVPEEPSFADISDSFPEPKPDTPPAYSLSLEAAISYSFIYDQLPKNFLQKKNDSEEEMLPTIDIFDSDDEELDVNMDNQNPVETVSSPLNLFHDEPAGELPKNDKPIITSIEYLTPKVQLTNTLHDTRSSVHSPPPPKILCFSNIESLQEQLNNDSPSQDLFSEELPKDDKPVITSIEYLTPQVTADLLDTTSTDYSPPAKISRFSNIESLQQVLNCGSTITSGDILISKVNDNTKQNGVRIESAGAGTVPLVKYLAISIGEVVSLEKPIDEIDIYPNIADQGLANPENSIEMIKEAPETLPNQGQYVAVKVDGKLSYLDPSESWFPIPPVLANASENKELQGNERVKIVDEKKELQSNTKRKIVADKKKLQSNTEDNILAKKEEHQSNKRVLRELQSNSKTKIVPDKQDLQSNTKAKIVADKQKEQNIERVERGPKRTVSGVVKLPTPNTYMAQTIPKGYIRLCPKILVQPKSGPGSQPHQPSDIPRKVRKIYPRHHMPVNGQLIQKMPTQTKILIAKPVPTTTVAAGGEAFSCRDIQVPGVRLDQASALTLATVQQNQKNLPIFGFLHAIGFTPFPARVLPESSSIIVMIPEVEAMLFKTLADANRFLNNHFSTNPEFEKLLPTEWKFSLWK